MTTVTAVQNKTDGIIKEIINRLDQSKIDVPMLPEVAGKVVRLTQDPNSDAAKLASLIQSDQSLAAHVMRVANSAAYSPNASMVSLQQAITRLGMRVIAEIALAASINTKLFNTPGYERYIQYILKCSLASGLWAKETARSCRKNVEAAFLAGLLNDIGRPIAVQLGLEISLQQNHEITPEEINIIEAQCSRQIGLLVLEEWGMPASVKNVLSYFDRYQEEHDGKLQTAIVVAGTAIAKHFYADSKHEEVLGLETLKNHTAFGEVNLYQDEVEQLLARSDAVNSAMEAMGL